jgi:aconitase B
MGDVIDIFPYEGKITRHGTDEVLARFELKTEVLIDEVRAGGRIPLIIGRGLTDKAREALGLPFSDRVPSPAAGGRHRQGLTPWPRRWWARRAACRAFARAPTASRR